MREPAMKNTSAVSTRSATKPARIRRTIFMRLKRGANDAGCLARGGKLAALNRRRFAPVSVVQAKSPRGFGHKKAQRLFGGETEIFRAPIGATHICVGTADLCASLWPTCLESLFGF